MGLLKGGNDMVSMPTGGKYSDNYIQNANMEKMVSNKGGGKVINPCGYGSKK
jgi:hypothetical protein